MTLLACPFALSALPQTPWSNTQHVLPTPTTVYALSGEL